MTVTTSTDPLLGAVLDGRYRLDSLIARGGMATVYVGFDTRLDREVAVKVMHPTLAVDDGFVERFRREAKSAARLSHPSVVAIYDQGEDRGRTYLVMEHVSGRTLREVLRESGRLSPAQALDVVDGVLTALAAAHAAGLVHRDVKPENVIVCPDGRVKVADFGLARAVEASSYTVAEGTLLGTVAYLAPEQVSGAADPRADLYALGVVLFELLTGRVPFTGETPLAVAYRHVNEDVPDPSTLVAGLPPAVGELVRAATRRDRDERYPDAQSMLSAVRRARAALGNTETSLLRLDEAPTVITTLPAVVPPPATPVKAAKPPEEPRQRRAWLVFTIVSLVILLIAGVAGWYLGSGRWTRTPGVEGLDRAAAVVALREAGLTLRLADARHHDTVPKDAVISQDPGPGDRVKKGAVVTLRLSLGVKMVTMPSVIGQTQARAESLLKKADLERGEVARQYSETVPRGLVVSASQPAGKSLKHGTKVSFVVSDGPAPVVVPDVRGRALDEARRALEALVLKVTVREEFSDTVGSGRVIDQSPGSGGSVPRGTTVTLRVSKGPQVVAVPDVRGESIGRATQRLEALGLKVFVDHVRNGNGDIVLDQDPPGGARVRVGTTVTLVAF